VSQNRETKKKLKTCCLFCVLIVDICDATVPEIRLKTIETNDIWMWWWSRWKWNIITVRCHLQQGCLGVNI